jgi:hypothetical protein
MAKSKYPNQVDTPSELPVVRDNIFEIGSDAINSLRSAIIQIEKTLGINPQGAVGLTVGERISQSLDSSGNLKREAVDRAGIISGPIFDDQVSDSAAIKENKLKLNFPTNVLQSQISHVSSLIDEIQFQVEQISSKLSAHLSPEAAGRHPATAISTTVIEATSSQLGIRSSSSSNVQALLGSIFSSHINYDGTLISETNNSHSANQVYFDNTSTTGITSSDVQGAIEDVAAYLQEEVVEHQKLFHSAGSSRASNIYDVSDLNYGTIFINSVTSSIFKNLGEKPYFEITLDLPTLIPTEEIKIGDLVELTVNSVKKEYQIYKVIYDSTDENILGFYLFGIFSTNEIGIFTKVFSRRLKSNFEFGLIASSREHFGLSSSSLVQVINLDAPHIQSFGINPNEISLSNRYFDLKINGIQYSFDVYNTTLLNQSIDSIIKSINETVDYLGLPVLAFRVDRENKNSELVIAHNVSANDLSEASLEVVRVDGSIDSLGLSSYESKIIYGKPGTSHYIGGRKYNGLLKKLDLTGFDIQSGSRNINSGALGIDFLDYELKKGDIVNIIDSFYNSYEVVDVTSSYISVSPRQLPSGFPTASVGTARIIVYESTVDASNFEFLKIGVISTSSVGSSLFEIFLDQNRKLNLNLILEQESEIYSNKSIYQVIGFNNPGLASSIQINFENTVDSCVNVWLDDFSEKKKIVGDFNYLKLKSNNSNFECLVYIPSVSAIYNYASGVGGSFIKFIYPDQEINRENNLVISNIHYSNLLGKFDGGINGSFFSSKINFGNLEEKDISTKLKEVLTETPILELRSSGFVSGLKIIDVVNPDGYSSGTYLVSIEAGVCYIEGKRFIISAVNSYDSGVDASVYDKLYVGIDRHGNFIFSGPNSTCDYPWAEEPILLIGTVENTGTAYNIIDQRLFINNLDLKLLNSITVSPQPGMGHFSSLPDALKYAKRFSEIFPNAGTPEIHLKSGKHTVSYDLTTTSSYSTWISNITSSSSSSDKTNFYTELIRAGLAVDFPVTISGEGDGTELELIINLNTSDYVDFQASSRLAVLGNGFNTTGSEATIAHGRLSSGVVTFKNFKFTKGTILFVDLNNYDGTDCLDFLVNVNQINFESSEYLVFVEASDSTSTKGNVIISNNKLHGGIVQFPFTTSVANRLKNINISNNIIPNTSTFGLFVGSNVYLLAENNISYTGNMSGVTSTSVRKDRVGYDLFVPHNTAIGNNLTVSNDSTFSGLITASSDISVLGTTGSGDVSAKSFTISGLSNLIRTMSMTDFYSVIQLPSATYTNNNATWSYGLGATQLDIPGQVTLQNSGSYIWIILDSYLINNSTLESIKLICSSNANLTMQLDIYDSNSIGSNTSPTFVDSDSNIINNLDREELTFNFDYLYSINKICYLKIGVSSGTGSVFLYKLSLSINTNDSISTSLNLI